MRQQLRLVVVVVVVTAHQQPKIEEEIKEEGRINGSVLALRFAFYWTLRPSLLIFIHPALERPQAAVMEREVDWRSLA